MPEIADQEITVDHDQLMDAHHKWAKNEGDRASDAGTDRVEIGKFLEKTGIHGKALSAVRAGMKLKKDASKLDWLRSMEALLPMVADHIRGQATSEMDLSGEVPFEEAAE